jgi:outer membrane lipoprotein-sorting protein
VGAGDWRPPTDCRYRQALVTIRGVTTERWARAALVPIRRGQRQTEIVALAPGLPTVDELFTFMRDAERRFETLMMRIEEHTYAGRGEQVEAIDVAMRHPGKARVVTTQPGTGAAGHHELWISDGEVVRTYSASHRLGTSRPVRNRVRGLDPGQYPGRSTVYEPITALPMETTPELFVHPAGYCQNVLATGTCWISGTDRVAGREAIVLECDHPRAVERTVDRPDYHVQVTVDRLDGIVTRFVESVGGEVTRLAEVVHFEPDAALPATTFDFEFPEGTTLLY